MLNCIGCMNRNRKPEICKKCIGYDLYESPGFLRKPTDISKEMAMLGLIGTEKKMEIERVIFNDPATIVLWEDGIKTVVKCDVDDIYDPEKGLAMAIAKRFLGNKGNYYKVFKKWLPEEENINFDPVTLLTPEELAEKLGCTKATIQKRCRQGVYPGAVKVGGKWKIPY